MPRREQTIAGKPVRIIEDISRDLLKSLPDSLEYEFIVLISKYNSGKSSSAVRILFKYFGEENTEYVTLTEQYKENNEEYKDPTLRFGEVPHGKTVVFDEINSDGNISAESITRYIRDLARHNRAVILSNPYGMTDDAMHEIKLFIRKERKILPAKMLFIFVTNQHNKQ